MYNIIYKNKDKDSIDIENVGNFIADNLTTIDKIYNDKNEIVFNSSDIKKVIESNKKYIRTFEGFTETTRKYYDVVFKENTTFKNVYNGEDSDMLDVNINSGDKIRLYVNTTKSDGNKLIIKGFRPLLDIKSNENVSVNASSLWNGGFILNDEVEFPRSNNIFEII